MSKPSDLLQGTLDLLLLKILALEPLHGWAIGQRLKQVSGDVLQVNDGSTLSSAAQTEAGRVDNGLGDQMVQKLARSLNVVRVESCRHRLVGRAAANPCNSPTEARPGLRAPRHSPDPLYMPRSVSPVGLAQSGVIPQNNSTRECSFCDLVVVVVVAEDNR